MEAPNLIKAGAEPCTSQQHHSLVDKFILDDPDLAIILSKLQELDLPDWRLVSGAIYQTIWNRLTNKPQGHGIKDFDIAYFDDSDLSYEAEDEVIQRVNKALPDYANRLEVRNQARVHLWYREKFAGDYPQLTCTDESLDNYMCTTHAVAVRLEQDGSLSVAAPFGLEDIFQLTIRPNKKLPTNVKHYGDKAKRMARLWPELKVLDWETEQPIRPELL